MIHELQMLVSVRKLPVLYQLDSSVSCNQVWHLQFDGLVTKFCWASKSNDGRLTHSGVLFPTIYSQDFCLRIYEFGETIITPCRQCHSNIFIMYYSKIIKQQVPMYLFKINVSIYLFLLHFLVPYHAIRLLFLRAINTFRITQNSFCSQCLNIVQEQNKIKPVYNIESRGLYVRVTYLNLSLVSMRIRGLLKQQSSFFLNIFYYFLEQTWI